MTDTAPLGPEAQFRAFLDQGKFMIQRSKSTGTYVFYPRVSAPGTGESDLEWVEVGGDGVVYSTTVVHNRPEKGGDYNIALIDLAEGPRMMSRVVGVEPAAVRIGMKVRARVGELDGAPQVLFTPV
jgi:hypothetical protein